MTSDELTSLVRGFEDCTLPAERWTHQAHLCVALWNLHHFPREVATRRIRTGIQRYNAHNGKPNGYHETITLAWVGIISRLLNEWAAEDVARSEENGSLQALGKRLITQCGRSDYLLRHYRRETLFSEKARNSFVPPDLQPIEP